jgi:diaminohydroxyphosphoribosylaminopyrimidine deaminase/5-amino-6-(5-phosphoribosylamino)uracil reductase
VSADRWMARCLELAERARGRTAPNPMVGALIVSGEEVLAEGWHHAAGQPHAEIEALRAAGERARGCTMVVNLEPCCHYGRTPPCTEAIIAAGITRVIVGMEDPDPRMQGRAIQLLRDVGIEVELGVLGEECRRLNRAYLIAKEQSRPMIVLKAALSLDGRIASAEGESQWITGEPARQAGHGLRDVHDAVLVGSGTLIADNPSLSTRVEGGRNARPVLLDTELRCAPDARVLSAGLRPLIYCAVDAPQRDLDADIVRVERSDAGLELSAVLSDLVSQGILSVLVEGGGRVHHSLLSRGWVDQVHLFIAPMVLAEGPGWVRGTPFPLRGAPRLQVQEVSSVGEDIHLVLEPR